MMSSPTDLAQSRQTPFYFPSVDGIGDMILILNIKYLFSDIYICSASPLSKQIKICLQDGRWQIFG